MVSKVELKQQMENARREGAGEKSAIFSVDNKFILSLKVEQKQALKILVGLLYEAKDKKYAAETWTAEFNALNPSQKISSPEALKDLLGKMAAKISKNAELSEYLKNKPGKDSISAPGKQSFVAALKDILSTTK